MSKAQTIRELRLEVECFEEDFETLRADYAAAIRQRDAAEFNLKTRLAADTVRVAAKKEAAIQEKVDGIRAGLIPVEELRKHIRSDFKARIMRDHLGYEFELFFGQNHTDRVSLAIRDAILKEHAPKPKYASGGYVFPPTLGSSSIFFGRAGGLV